MDLNPVRTRRDAARGASFECNYPAFAEEIAAAAGGLPGDDRARRAPTLREMLAAARDTYR